MSKLMYEGLKTQSTDAVKALLSWKGVSCDPLPKDITLDGGRLVLVLSKKKDAYYVVTSRSCSCPSSIYSPGKPCKHRATYFAQPKPTPQPDEDLRASLPGWPQGAHGPVEA